jgi:hypothetical protein
MTRSLLLGFGLRLLKAGVDFRTEPVSCFFSFSCQTENARINAFDGSEILNAAFTKREGRLLARREYVTLR